MSFYGRSDDILDNLQGNKKYSYSDDEDECQEFNNEYEDDTLISDTYQMPKWIYKPIKIEDDIKECPICFDNTDLVELSCHHKYCHECISQYIKIKVNDLYTELRHIRFTLVKEEFALAINKIWRFGICCPSSGCWAVLESEFIKEHAGESTEHMFNHLLLRQTIQSIGDVRHCPFGCGGYLQEDCLCTNEDCREVMIRLRNIKENEDKHKFTVWSRINSKLCPNCNVQIEKNGGCNNMVCMYCSYRFLWDKTYFIQKNHLWSKESIHKNNLMPKDDKELQNLYVIAEKEGVLK